MNDEINKAINDWFAGGNRIPIRLFIVYVACVVALATLFGAAIVFAFFATN